MTYEQIKSITPNAMYQMKRNDLDQEDYAKCDELDQGHYTICNYLGQGHYA